MIWGKNKLGNKKMKQLERILGLPVQSAFANGGDLPHFVVIAFTSPKDAYLVNTKRGYFKKYLSGGKFLLTRPNTKIKVWTPNEPTEAARYKDAKQVAEEYFLGPFSYRDSEGAKGRDFMREIKEAEEEIDRRLCTGDPEFDYEPELIGNPDMWDIT